MLRVEVRLFGAFRKYANGSAVSLEVPRTFTELTAAMRGFVPFAISFTFLVWIWFQHARFFRRFRMDDAGAVAINGVLLFVIVFYVYPMKFLWNMLFAFWTRAPRTVPGPEGAPVPIIESSAICVPARIVA